MEQLTSYQRITCKCLNPQLIFNKYTGENVVVPCRKCTGCLTSRSNTYTAQCKTEQSHHKYCYFVTLTYNNYFIPKAIITKNHVSNTVELINITPRFPSQVLLSLPKKYTTQVNSVALKQSLSTNNKQNHDKNIITYASKKDLQKFIKRVRYHINKISGEKIRHFSVSEFGSKTLRPHFHLLLFFDKPQTLQIIGKVINQSWKYGNNCSELAKSSCSSYVSSYINSTVSLPYLLKAKIFKPFTTHSKYLGLTMLLPLKENIYQTPINSLNTINLQFYGSITTLYTTKQFSNAFFPRCYSFSLLPTYSIYKLYTFYEELRTDYIQQYGTSDFVIKELIHLLLNPKYNYISDILQLPKDEEWHYIEIYYQRVYNAILLSRYFTTFICNSDPSLYKNRVNHIIEYYNYQSLHLLHEFYNSQQNYSLTTQNPDYSIFYTPLDKKSLKMWNLVNKYHPIYKSTKLFYDNNANLKQKHKKYNDLIGLLNNN